MKNRIIRRCGIHSTLWAGLIFASIFSAWAVEPDTEGPRLLSVRGAGFPHGLVVTFSEPVDPITSVDKANYQLTGQPVTLNAVERVSSIQVVLKVTAYNTDPLTVAVNNIKDISPNANLIAADSQRMVAFKSNLGGYWTFDDERGRATMDLSSDNDGTFVNDPIWSTDSAPLGRPNPSALQFDGVDDYVQTVYPGVGGTNPRTVSFWIKTDVNPQNTHGIIAWGNSTANTLKYHVRLTSAGAIRTEFQGGNNRGVTLLNDGLWHHVISMLPAGVLPNQSGIQHYVDGILEGVGGTGAGGINTDITSANAIRVRIGARDQTGAVEAFPGLIDEVAIFEGALTPNQISELSLGADPLQFATPIAGAVALTQEPEDRTVGEVETPTFSVGASGSPAIGYQWFKNGQPIPGAKFSSYTTPPTSPQDDQAKFHVEVFNVDGSFNRITSRAATLRVSNDHEAPEVVSIRGAGTGVDQVIIQFNEPLDPVSGGSVNTYSIEGIAINSLSLDGTGMKVTLSTAALTDGNVYTLAIQGLKDASVAGNLLSTNIQFKSQATFPDVALADHPVRYWRFEEGSGSTSLASETSVLDSAAGAAISNIQGNPDLGARSLLPDDPDGHGAGFEAAVAAQVLVAPNGQDINMAVGPWAKKTYEFWFLATTLPSADSTGASRGWGLYEQGGGDRGVSIYLYGTQSGINPGEANLVFSALNRVDDGAGSPWGDPAVPETVVFVESPVQANVAYHVVAVMDGDDTDQVDPGTGKFLGSLKLYLNGNLVGEAAGVGLLYNHNSDVQIGRGSFRDHTNVSGAHGWFDGIVDEFLIYNSALTAERVKLHYDTAFSGLQTGAIEITKQPADTSAPESGEATFWVEFTGTPPWTSEWFLNDQEILGAVTIAGQSTITFPVTADHQGAKVKTIIRNEDGPVTSREAILTVILDTAPPQIVSVQGGAGLANYVFVRFNEKLDLASAEDMSNYSISGLTVLSADLNEDFKEVVLRTTPQTAGTPYTLEVSGVKDTAVGANALTGSAAFVSTLSYRVEVLSDDPDVYFPLGEPNGATAFDLMGKDPNYTGDYLALAAGGAMPRLGEDRLVPGAPDGAVGLSASAFNLIGFSIDSALVNSAGPYEDKTVELWFKPARLPRFVSGTSPEKMVLFEQGGTTRGLAIYLSGIEDIEVATQADLYFHAWNDSADPVSAPWGGPEEETKWPIFVRTTIRLNETYHAVMVLDGDNTGGLTGRLDGYLNGQLIAAEMGENLGVGLLYAHGDDAGLGAVHQNAVYHDQNRSIGNGDYFEGVLDEFAIYNRALSASRVEAHYNQGLIPIEEVPSEIRITAMRIVGSTVTIEWSGGGTLESSGNVTGPYAVVTGAAAGSFSGTIPAGTNRFYRVRRNP